MMCSRSRCVGALSEGVMNRTVVAELVLRLSRAGLAIIKTEQLFFFDGKRGFSLGQGQ